ncbi:hypothetical protein HME9302_02291 [Alteripontixanthobacter maritimus]|uniref:YdbS-like PH domain-containing protein n=1 Tax=Alteripontixanthobacter maritimus TaxID=2161824 RepID=A0A369Q856_9SPHN|nr:PH domain-containing protein [Alteripontixanthobacter maritimus]RDC61073.1 hypothetical protein HME9302_02291 [Alteripontixanthobacter maritimus]
MRPPALEAKQKIAFPVPARETASMDIETTAPVATPPSNTGDAPLTELDPRYRTVLRIELSILAAIVVIGAGVLEFVVPGWTGVFFIPVLLLAALVIIRIPMRRYHARGYTMGADRLRVVRGIWFRSDTVVPFGRVQHIDVGQGPLERAFGLSNLTLHTAGSHNASVNLPGLATDDANAMREEIRAHIKRETL